MLDAPFLLLSSALYSFQSSLSLFGTPALLRFVPCSCLALELYLTLFWCYSNHPCLYAFNLIILVTWHLSWSLGGDRVALAIPWGIVCKATLQKGYHTTPLLCTNAECLKHIRSNTSQMYASGLINVVHDEHSAKMRIQWTRNNLRVGWFAQYPLLNAALLQVTNG